MLAKIKSFVYWVGAQIKNHPYLALFSTILLLATSYFILPFVGISALTIGIAASISIIVGPVLGGLLGWVGEKIKSIFILPPPKEELLPLPDPLQDLILDYAAGDIGGKEQKLANYSSAHYCRLFESGPEEKPYDKIPLIVFLQCVVRGEQKQAEEMLKEAQKQNSELFKCLLTMKARVMDLSGRIFKKITAFQYTLWAKDRHMWEMLLKYLPKNIALNQLQDHEKNGVSYELEGKMIHEKHYDFSLLIEPLQEYVDSTAGIVPIIQDEADKIWCQKVGRAQRYVPVHVVNEYLREDRSFKKVSNNTQFKENDLPRSILFYHWGDLNYYSWFDYPGMGITYAVYRGEDNKGALASGLVGIQALIDLRAIEELQKIRTEEYQVLKETLHNQLSQLLSRCRIM